MDTWQEHIYRKCKSFCDREVQHQENEVQMPFGERELYVIMKALEDQQKYKELIEKMSWPLSADGPILQECKGE